ncbi:MAG TPA: hypothetical protein VHO90_04740 [Bacteroidales bacterium]|nr:hypothetical protein [Bacteroidales bacterium]
MKLQHIVLYASIMAGIISCSVYSRKTEPRRVDNENPVYKILYYASLAASSHNTQPWKVEVIGTDSLVVFPDFSRKLTVVDPHSRELFISLGAFIENLDIASNYLGYITSIQVCHGDGSTCDNTFITVSLKKGKRLNLDITETENRRTLRSAFDTAQIADSAISILTSENVGTAHFVSNRSSQGKYIKRETIEAYAQQARCTEAQDELAKWIRFSNTDVKNKRDGLTTSGMEINGIAGWFVRNFFTPDDSKKEAFISGGIERTCNQVENCGGWILITQPSESPANWISTGRIVERINIKCLELMLGFHPMSQMIEEQDFEKQVNIRLGYSGIIQFVARVGHVKDYPKPVSVRREVDSFSKFR